MDTATLLWGTLFGSIGVGYVMYGRKQKKPIPLACGIMLIGYSYAVTNTLLLVGIGALLMAIPVAFHHQ